jgi:hypothetical protein
MVGQDLGRLSSLSDWTKLMIYGHAYGPATLPFELTDLVQWLINRDGLSEIDSLRKLSVVFGFSLPNSLSTLREVGLSSQALAIEFESGQQLTENGQLLVGVELVEIPGVSELKVSQLEENLRGFKAAGADGLAPSWDLWHMPLDRLALVNQVWGAD